MYLQTRDPERQHSKLAAWLSAPAMGLLGWLGAQTATSTPDIAYPDAKAFLVGYYKEITNPTTFSQTYESSVAPAYRSDPERSTEAARTWWAKYERAAVSGIRPVEGPPNRFRANVTFYARGWQTKKKEPGPESLVFTLTCRTWLAQLPIYTCPQDQIMIEIVEKLETSPGA